MGIFDDLGGKVKEALPTIGAAIGLAATGGSPYGAAIGSGIGSLAAGKETEDALVNAALAGGISQGLRSANIIGPEGRFFTGPAVIGDTMTVTGGGGQIFPQGKIGPQFDTANYLGENFDPDVVKVIQGPENALVNKLSEKALLDDVAGANTSGGILDFLKKKSVQDITNNPEFEVLIEKGLSPKEAYDIVEKKMGIPDFIKYAGIPLGLGALAAFSTPKMGGGEESYNYFLDDPESYMVDTGQIQKDFSDVIVPNPDDRGIMSAAKGGEARFPRRTGGIGPGEGSGTKDDVPAMLMDGEFVMTRDAVKGAGDGDIRKGIQRMYGMMDNFENKARA